MSRDNRIHSFTLNPGASEIISKVNKGKKSRFVSNAISWYAKPREYVMKPHNYTNIDGDVVETEYEVKMFNISELVEAQDSILDKFTQVCIERDELRSKLNQSIWQKLSSKFSKK